jgi:FtsH-binding integral membrane protein
MAAGVALTGVAAYGLYSYAMSNPQVFAALFKGPAHLVLVFAPLLFGMYLIFRLHAMSVSTARTSFFIYAALIGLMLSSLFVAYSAQSLARVFFISSAMFGTTSLWGYTTRRDLTGFGSFLLMGLFGLIIAMVVNIFMASTALQFAVSVLGVFIFAGLTAYDTQKLKDVYLTNAGDELALGQSAVRGALTLYLDFINLFLMLLQLMGSRRD